MMMIQLEELVSFLDKLLAIDRFKDYCPNGLQVQGKSEITKIVCGVSICQELIDYAISVNADAIIVHHGLFWNKSSQVITGTKKNRIKSLLMNDISLLAYHLPLDAHPLLGNNMQLAKLLEIGCTGISPTNDYLCHGVLSQPTNINDFIKKTEQICNTAVHYYGDSNKTISTIAWCTGGGDSIFEEAITLGVDLYITGEDSEPVYNLAHESGVGYLSLGHYVSERYGIMALSPVIQQELNIFCEFVDIYNPI